MYDERCRCLKVGSPGKARKLAGLRGRFGTGPKCSRSKTRLGVSEPLAATFERISAIANRARCAIHRAIVCVVAVARTESAVRRAEPASREQVFERARQELSARMP